MITQRIFSSVFLFCFLFCSMGLYAQKESSKKKNKKEEIHLVTGWYPISQNKGSVERKLSHNDEVFTLISKPIVLWSDVETVRLVNHERFNYGAILIGLKKTKIEELKKQKKSSKESQWGLIVDDELVLVQSIDKERFSGNFQVSTQENIEWLEELYESLKVSD